MQRNAAQKMVQEVLEKLSPAEAALWRVGVWGLGFRVWGLGFGV